MKRHLVVVPDIYGHTPRSPPHTSPADCARTSPMRPRSAGVRARPSAPQSPERASTASSSRLSGCARRTGSDHACGAGRSAGTDSWDSSSATPTSRGAAGPARRTGSPPSTRSACGACPARCCGVGPPELALGASARTPSRGSCVTGSPELGLGAPARTPSRGSCASCSTYNSGLVEAWEERRLATRLRNILRKPQRIRIFL